MAFEKGNNLGAGRGKGSPNKATAKVREAIAVFADANVEKLQGWLDRVATDDPKSAITLYKDIIEYHIPKLARKDVQMLDENGQPANPSFDVAVKFVGTDADKH